MPAVRGHKEQNAASCFRSCLRGQKKARRKQRRENLRADEFTLGGETAAVN